MHQEPYDQKILAPGDRFRPREVARLLTSYRRTSMIKKREPAAEPADLDEAYLTPADLAELAQILAPTEAQANVAKLREQREAHAAVVDAWLARRSEAEDLVKLHPADPDDWQGMAQARRRSAAFDLLRTEPLPHAAREAVEQLLAHDQAIASWEPDEREDERRQRARAREVHARGYGRWLTAYVERAHDLDAVLSEALAIQRDLRERCGEGRQLLVRAGGQAVSAPELHAQRLELIVAQFREVLAGVERHLAAKRANGTATVRLLKAGTLPRNEVLAVVERVLGHPPSTGPKTATAEWERVAGELFKPPWKASLNAGDVASFPREQAEALVKAGMAEWHQEEAA